MVSAKTLYGIKAKPHNRVVTSLLILSSAMASSSSASLNIITIAHIAAMVSDKLSSTNYIVWRDQLIPLIESIQMNDHIWDGYELPKAIIVSSNWQGGTKSFVCKLATKG